MDIFADLSHFQKMWIISEEKKNLQLARLYRLVLKFRVSTDFYFSGKLSQSVPNLETQYEQELASQGF